MAEVNWIDVVRMVCVSVVELGGPSDGKLTTPKTNSQKTELILVASNSLSMDHHLHHQWHVMSTCMGKERQASRPYPSPGPHSYLGPNPSLLLPIS